MKWENIEPVFTVSNILPDSAWNNIVLKAKLKGKSPAALFEEFIDDGVNWTYFTTITYICQSEKQSHLWVDSQVWENSLVF